MDITEYYSRLERCSEQIRALEAEKLKIRRDYASELTAKYSEYVGKKVRITTKQKFGKDFSVIGFFKGYVAGAYNPLMVVHKLKKDGTASINTIPCYELPIFGDFTFNIEIVE